MAELSICDKIISYFLRLLPIMARLLRKISNFAAGKIIYTDI
jgi:hypothetical protein